MAARTWLLGCALALALGCGNNGGSNSDANGGGGDDDSGTIGPDAFENPATCGDGVCEAGEVCTADCFSGACTVGGTSQCSDCMDNDMDTKIDGFDPECSGPADDLEDSFATGIPGDNMDATSQDCFFDGDSGGGNDGCSQHVCCLLRANNVQECAALAPNSNYDKYDKNKCYQPWGNVAVPSKCSMNCGPLSPPGCDCFGCCTVCNGGATTCRDIVLNPAVSPNCDQNNITDPGPDGALNTADDPCKACTKNPDCGSSTCGGATCILCPGQDPSSLPSSCTGGATCPDGYAECEADGSCAVAGTYCSNGCCVGMIL